MSNYDKILHHDYGELSIGMEKCDVEQERDDMKRKDMERRKKLQYLRDPIKAGGVEHVVQKGHDYYRGVIGFRGEHLSYSCKDKAEAERWLNETRQKLHAEYEKLREELQNS